jgi:hypothetical protein
MRYRGYCGFFLKPQSFRRKKSKDYKNAEQLSREKYI